MSAAVRPLAFLRLCDTKTPNYTPPSAHLLSAPADLTDYLKGAAREYRCTVSLPYGGALVLLRN